MKVLLQIKHNLDVNLAFFSFYNIIQIFIINNLSIMTSLTQCKLSLSTTLFNDDIQFYNNIYYKLNL